MTAVDTRGDAARAGLNVLLVEDDGDIRRLLRFCLTDGTAADCFPRLRRLQPSAWIVVYAANRAAAGAAGVINAGADLLVEKMSVGIDNLVTLALSREH